MFLISKLITCFIDGFTSRMKSQSIAYLLIGSAYINAYLMLDLEGEVRSILGVDKWPSRMQGRCFFRSWAGWIAIFG
jgi:hypothetical protein